MYSINGSILFVGHQNKLQRRNNVQTMAILFSGMTWIYSIFGGLFAALCEKWKHKTRKLDFFCGGAGAGKMVRI